MSSKQINLSHVRWVPHCLKHRHDQVLNDFVKIVSFPSRMALLIDQRECGIRGLYQTKYQRRRHVIEQSANHHWWWRNQVVDIKRCNHSYRLKILNEHGGMKSCCCYQLSRRLQILALDRLEYRHLLIFGYSVTECNHGH